MKKIPDKIKGAPHVNPMEPVETPTKRWIKCNKCQSTAFGVTAVATPKGAVLADLMCLNPTCRQVIDISDESGGSCYTRSGHTPEQKAKDKKKQGKGS